VGSFPARLNGRPFKSAGQCQTLQRIKAFILPKFDQLSTTFSNIWKAAAGSISIIGQRKE
jgi:hypothetical protein